MLMTEMHTARIPGICRRFADVIGDRHWKNRVAQLKQEMKGNRFLVEHLKRENAIAFQLNHLQELTAKFGGIPVQESNNHFIYSAMSFAAQVLFIIDASLGELAEQFRRRVHGAFRNPDDMRGLRLELGAATHFARRGHTVIWPEMGAQRHFAGRLDHQNDRV